jgi:imidazoleglycerol-phosphate dehydratase
VNDRGARRHRTTSETEVEVELCLDGGPVSNDTGVAFFDHMLDQLGRHARLGLSVYAKGDLDVDAHHTVEDVGIVLGDALDAALGDRRGIRRFGSALVPMDEALAQCALDISGRARLVFEAEFRATTIGTYSTSLTEEFLHALVRSAGLTLHVRLLAGRDSHHATEAIFKSLGRALADAVLVEPGASGEVPSTKGVL